MCVESLQFSFLSPDCPSASAMPRIGKSIEEIVLSRSLPSRDSSGAVSQPLQQHLPPSRGNHRNRPLGIGSRGPSPSALTSTSSSSGPPLFVSTSSSQSRPSARNKQAEQEKVSLESLMEHSHSLQLYVKVPASHSSPPPLPSLSHSSSSLRNCNRNS